METDEAERKFIDYLAKKYGLDSKSFTVTSGQKVANQYIVKGTVKEPDGSSSFEGTIDLNEGDILSYAKSEPRIIRKT